MPTVPTTIAPSTTRTTGSPVGVWTALAAMALCTGSGLVDRAGDAELRPPGAVTAPSDRTVATPVLDSPGGPVTTVWRPR